MAIILGIVGIPLFYTLPTYTALAILLSIAGLFVVIMVGYKYWFRVNEKSLPFNKYTTSNEAMAGIDLSGKIAIITGCNTGIGKHTAKRMYQHGCSIIMACRNLEKANKARLDMLDSAAASPGTIDVMQLDLSSLQSVHDFASAFSKTSKSIDYLILNAGIMALPEFEISTDGYELQWAVNHLGHFYLTILLMPTLIQSKSRVISLTSLGHAFCSESQYEQFLIEGMMNSTGPSMEAYGKWLNYGISKCSNILFARELQRRYRDQGIIAVSAHPGVIGTTGLYKEVTADVVSVKLVLKHMSTPKFFMTEIKGLDQGTATVLRCVAMEKDEIKGGHFYVNCRSGNDDGRLKEAAVVTDYEDEKKSKEARLWALSEQLITKKGFPVELSTV